VQSGAPDLRFLDKDGITWLDYEIERWDQTNNVAEVWVLVPTITGDTDSVYMTMYYDDVVNGSIADGQCATCVFDTANGFYSDWHLNEDPSGGTIYDRTANNYDGTPTSMNASNLVDGIIGKGLSFDGSADYINITTTQVQRDNITNSGNYTISGWMKASSQTGTHSLVDFSVTNMDYAYVGLGFGYTGYTHYPYAWHSDDVSSGQPDHYWVWMNTSKAIDDNLWHCLVITRNSATSFSFYIDGTLINTSTKPSVGTTTTDRLQIGRNPYNGGSQYFNGTIDEVNILSTNVSADWVKLSYENQKASQTLVSY
jgi:hypothetical protein